IVLRVREIQERYWDVWVSERQRLPRRYLRSPYWRSSAKRLEAERWAAEAGLLSSWARLPASLPRAESFSACCSMRVTSRTRSSRVETQRCVIDGMAASRAGKWDSWRLSDQLGPTVKPSPP